MVQKLGTNSPAKTSKSTIDAHSVSAFVRRVKNTFLAILTIGLVILLFLVYTPLKINVEKSLISNLVDISSANYASLQNHIDKNIVDAKSLANRNMIRLEIIKYLNGERDLDALKQYYSESRYTDGAEILSSLLASERYLADNEILIASYEAADVEYSKILLDKEIFTLSDKPEVKQKIIIDRDKNYLVVCYPVSINDQLLAWDKLIFSLPSEITSGNMQIVSRIATKEEALSLQKDAKTIKEKNRNVYRKEGFYFDILALSDGLYLISSQSDASLSARVHPIALRVFGVAAATLLFFGLIVYYYIILFAKKELRTLEESQTALAQAVTEADIDTLTGAVNRRGGVKYLHDVFEKFKHTLHSPAIIMYDIDKFKYINDTYGHLAGDVVLKKTTQAIQKNVREEDSLIRWGGDEFVGVFHRIKKENALFFAERLRDTISKIELEVDGRKIDVSISVGITYFEQQDTEYLQALQRADAALYQCKDAGGCTIRRA